MINGTNIVKIIKRQSMLYSKVLPTFLLLRIIFLTKIRILSLFRNNSFTTFGSKVGFMHVNAKNKRIIARLLLCCIALVSLPFHSFLHQHNDEYHIEKHTSGLNDSTEISEYTDCVSCIIAQIDITFIHQKEWKLPPIVFGIIYINDFLSQIAKVTYSASSRAPPTYFL